MGGEIEFTVRVAEVLRGNAAWQRIVSANQFNDPAPEGMEYILVRVVVEYTGSDEGPLELETRDWAVVTKGRFIDYFQAPSVCCLPNEFELTLFSGGSGDGWMAWPVAVDDDSPMLALGGTEGIFFSVH